MQKTNISKTLLHVLTFLALEVVIEPVYGTSLECGQQRLACKGGAGSPMHDAVYANCGAFSAPAARAACEAEKEKAKHHGSHNKITACNAGIQKCDEALNAPPPPKSDVVPKECLDNAKACYDSCGQNKACAMKCSAESERCKGY